MSDDTTFSFSFPPDIEWHKYTWKRPSEQEDERLWNGFLPDQRTYNNLMILDVDRTIALLREMQIGSNDEWELPPPQFIAGCNIIVPGPRFGFHLKGSEF